MTPPPFIGYNKEEIKEQFIMTFPLRPHQQDMLNAMAANAKGIIQCPTGGGKTYTFITDARRHLHPGKVVVVVAPRILLIKQLFNEFDTHLSDTRYAYLEVSSEGRTLRRKPNLFRNPIQPVSATTFTDDISDFYRRAASQDVPLIVFTTYASLQRVTAANLPIEVVYYDEAHNAAASDSDANIYQAVKALVSQSQHNYFFTATPKTSRAGDGCGMNNALVYGQNICTVPFDELVTTGVIVPPRLHIMDSNVDSNNQAEWRVNMATIKEVVNNYATESTVTGFNRTDSIPNNKILFCAQGTKSISDLIKKGGLVEYAQSVGFHVLTTDSRNGKFIDGVKVKEQEFLQTLNEWGEQPDKKFMVFHFSQISEGIDIKAFTGVVFLRNTANDIYITQTIGRVLRASEGKRWGYVIIPKHNDVGEEINGTIQNVVTTLLESGVPPAVLVGESQGRGEDEEIVEPLEDDSVDERVSTAVFNWEHSSALNKLIDKFVTMNVFELAGGLTSS